VVALEIIVGERDVWDPHLLAILVTTPARTDVIENLLLLKRLILYELIEFNKQWHLEKNGVKPAVVAFECAVSPVHHLQKMTIFTDVPVVCDL
jgi:hypothetical protein